MAEITGRAAQAYNDTFKLCRYHVETWGFDNRGFNRIISQDNYFSNEEVDQMYKYCLETRKNLNAIKQMFDSLDSESQMIYKWLNETLSMVKITIENERKYSLHFSYKCSNN